MTWPTLKLAEKQAFYSKFACHELNFFIAQKDPDFFKAIVKPYLVYKKDKTFLDHWLLESDLKDYLQPWKFDRLNSVERVLLAQRLVGEPTRTARHLKDLYHLLPPDTERRRMLYETALKAGDSAAGDQNKSSLLKLKSEKLGKLLDNAPDQTSLEKSKEALEEAAKSDPTSASGSSTNGLGMGGAGGGAGGRALGDMKAPGRARSCGKGGQGSE